MRKTTNWSFNDLVRVGADDLLKKGQAENFQKALYKAAAAVMFVIRDEFITQLPKTVEFDNAKFSIAVFEDSDTVVISYDRHVFEVNQRPNMGPTERGFMAFSLVTEDDDRRQAYVDRLNRIKDKANTLVKNMRENRAEFDKHAGNKTKEYLN